LHVLGIDTSCDDTGVAIVSNGRNIRSAHLSSQVELHRPYGGVVPEVASRAHANTLLPLLRQTLKDADLDARDLDGVAVTQGPGLVGCLLVGIAVAKSFAYGCGLPLVGVNHLNAHVYSAIFASEEKPVDHPHVALIVSGGHTAVYLVQSWENMVRLASTRDDAAGEAFDKVANLLNLGYPGGPVIERRAQQWAGDSIPFPRPLTGPTMAFSFSGLKTAVARYIESLPSLSDAEIDRICCSFQAAVAGSLVEKTLMAAQQHRVKTITLTGGVAANRTIRETMAKAARSNGMRLVTPPVSLCTDNGVMVAGLGTILLEKGYRAEWDMDAMP